MEEKQFVTDGAKETTELGEKIAKDFKPGDVVLLKGELGSGKTTFTKGVALGLGVDTRIMSPTFVLVRQHKGKIKDRNITFYHLDLYRMDSQESIINLGIEEILSDKNGVVLIEWGSKIKDIKVSYEIDFEVTDDRKRKITVKKYE